MNNRSCDPMLGALFRAFRQSRAGRYSGQIIEHTEKLHWPMIKNAPRFFFVVMVVLLVSVSLTFPALANASAQTPNGVVRAVLFWMNGCAHCHFVLEQILPPLQEKHGDRLQIKLVEVATAEDVDQLMSIAASFGIPKEQVGVPFLVIGENVLVGSEQIPAELPGLIDAYLASGGVDYPVIFKEVKDQEAPEPVTPIAEASIPADSPAIPLRSNGFNLAIVIMIGMVGALVYSGVDFLRGANDPVPELQSSWRDIATPILALVGLGVAAYLAYVETQAVEAICGPVGDCNAVQTSPYAYLFGMLPIGVLGVIGYLAILEVWLYARLRSDRLARMAPILIFGMALFGVLFSLYLTYLEPFVIRAVCIWCLTSAVIMTLLLLVSLKPAVFSISSKWRSDA
jgi:uncharacterized membrane protein